MVMFGVLFEVRTECLTIIQTNLDTKADWLTDRQLQSDWTSASKG
jgi:hypothetical protein